MLSFRKKKYKIYIVLFFFAVAFLGMAGVFGGDHIALAQNSGVQFPAGATEALGNEPTGEIAQVFKDILYAVLVLVLSLVNIAAVVFSWATKPEYISGPTGLLNLKEVYTLWQFIRDFFNLFFIFLLLFFAFAKVFQISRFNSFDVFKGIIIAAFLINFSFPITRLVIDAGNVPMYFFAQTLNGSNANAVPAAFFGDSNLANILVPKAQSGAQFSQLLTAIVFSFMLMISLLVLSVLFVIRLLALVILLIFSPVGIAASMVPGMKKYASDWWRRLFQYVFFGPAAMLMLVISIRFLTELNGSDLKGAYATGAAQVTTGAGSSDYLIAQGVFIIPIILIWMSIGLGQKFGIAGAQYVESKGRAAIKWGGRNLVAKPTKTLLRKADKRLASNRFTKYVSPGALKEAFKRRAEEQKHKDELPIKRSAAQIQDQLNAGISTVNNTLLPWNWRKGRFARNTDHTDHAFAELQSQAAHEKKEVTAVSNRSEYLIDELESAVARKDVGAATGIIQALADQNDINDLIMSDLASEVVGNKDLERDDTGKLVVSSKNAQEVLKSLLQSSGQTNEEAYTKQILSISERATAAGNYAFGGMVRYDGKHFTLANENQMASWSAAKVKNLETQSRQRTIHPDSLFTRKQIPELDKDGNIVMDKETGQPKAGGWAYGDLNGEVARQIMQTYTGADVKQADRSRDDMKQAIYTAYKNQGKKGYEGFTEMYTGKDKDGKSIKNSQDYEVFRKYVERIVELKEGGDGSGKSVKRAEKIELEPGESLSPGGIIMPPGSE